MYLFGTLFTMPSASSTISQMGEWSSTLFDEFWPIVVIVLGVGVVFMVLRWLGSLFDRH